MYLTQTYCLCELNPGLAFTFGSLQELVYISDVAVVPDVALDRLKRIPTIKLLIVDTLLRWSARTHFGIKDVSALSS